MKKRKATFSNIFFVNMMLLSIASTVVMGYFWIYHEWKHFQEEIVIQRKQFIETQKYHIKNETEKAIEIIYYKKSQTEERVKRNIRNRVCEAHSIATNLYSEYRGKLSDEEIIELIRDTLRPIRFNNGRGYYFIGDFQGVIILFADSPETEGKNLSDLKDTRGQYVIRDMTDIAKHSEEGYYAYHWTKPGTEGRDFPKLAFVKYFEPYRWYIGTGEYPDDTEKEVQQEVIERLADIRFNNEGYLFGSTFDGDPLFTNGIITVGSGNIWNLTDPDGVKIIQDQSRLAQTPDGGFHEYSWKKLSKSAPSPKISFVKGVKEWRWIIGAGCYTDDVEDKILQMRSDLYRDIRRHIEKIFLVFVILAIIIYAASKYIANRIHSNFQMISKFFERAAVEHLSIDTGSILFEELKHLAESANRMLDERNRIENALKANEERFDLAVRGANDGLWDRHIGSDAFYFSPRCKTMLGYDEDDDIASVDDWHDLIHPEDKAQAVSDLNAFLNSSDDLFERIYRMIRKNGSVIWIMNRGIAVRNPDGTPSRMVGFITDITSQKQTENALAEEKELLAVTLRSIREGVMTTDIHGNIALMNNAAETFTGWRFQEAVGKPVHDVFQIIGRDNGSSLQNPAELLLSDSAAVIKKQQPVILISRNGERRTIEENTAPVRDRKSFIIGAVLVFRDITEKIKMEEDFQKAKKLESVGILAGGIAHDYNNILTALLGNLTLAKMYAGSNEKVIRKLDGAETAIMKAKKLTHELLTFAKGGDPIKKITDIAPLVEESARFALSGSNVKLALRFSENLPRAEVDQNQFKQVIHNLVVNADQAMPDGGTVEIRAETAAASEIAHLMSSQNQYIRLTVKDEGVGIPEHHLDKIFDPYFTTKQMGHGLGLAASFSIIQKHQGVIEVTSEVGKGTAVCIYLPAAAPPKTGYGVAAKTQNKTLSVLLMDDEDMILDVTSVLIETFGYETETAKDGKEAVEKYRRKLDAGMPYDIVILDLTIPGGMGGQETIRKLLDIDPDVKAVVSSGYSNDPVMANFKEYGFKACIVKPFRLEELKEVLCAAGMIYI